MAQPMLWHLDGMPRAEPRPALARCDLPCDMPSFVLDSLTSGTCYADHDLPFVGYEREGWVGPDSRRHVDHLLGGIDRRGRLGWTGHVLGASA